MGTSPSAGLRVHLCHEPLVWLPQVEELALDTLDRSEGITTWERFAEMVINGQMALWVVHNGEELRGFYTTEILSTAQGYVVNVPFAGFDSDLRALLFSFKHAENTAREAGFVGFKWISSDPRWASIASRLGFEPRFVEYWKEFKE